MAHETNPNGTIHRPRLLGPLKVTEKEKRDTHAKADRHGISVAELIRRAVAAYPARPSVQP